MTLNGSHRQVCVCYYLSIRHILDKQCSTADLPHPDLTHIDVKVWVILKVFLKHKLTWGERLLPMVGLTALLWPVGGPKLSEYAGKLCRPDDRQYAEFPSWEDADELSPLWWTEVGGRGCGRWTVLVCSGAAEHKTWYFRFKFCEIKCLKSHKLIYEMSFQWEIKKCLTLGDRSRRVRTVWQLIRLKARHSRWRETARYEVVKSHQLVGSCLFPPSCPSVAEPHLKED